MGMTSNIHHPYDSHCGCGCGCDDVEDAIVHVWCTNPVTVPWPFERSHACPCQYGPWPMTVWSDRPWSRPCPTLDERTIRRYSCVDRYHVVHGNVDSDSWWTMMWWCW